MDNNPELNGKYLGTITEDFVAISETLKEASYAVRKHNYSDFPIFPICKTEQPIGQVLIGAGELNLTWNYFVTYLDEFVQRGIVDEDKVEDFKKAYKDPDEFCCLFVIDTDFTNFVYIPYPED